MSKRRRKLLISIAAVFAVVLGLAVLLDPRTSPPATPGSDVEPTRPVRAFTPGPPVRNDDDTISYTELRELIAGRRIAEATVDTSAGMAELRVRTADGDATEERRSFFAGAPDKLVEQLG